MLSKRHSFADFTSALYKYLKGIDSIDINVLGFMYNIEILLCPKWVDECYNISFSLLKFASTFHLQVSMSNTDRYFQIESTQVLYYPSTIFY